MLYDKFLTTVSLTPYPTPDTQSACDLRSPLLREHRVRVSHLRLCCILKVMQTLVKQDSGSGGVSSLMSAALERQTVSAAAIWQLLLAAQETETCPLNLLLEEVEREPGAGAFFRAGESSSLCLGVSLIERNVDP